MIHKLPFFQLYMNEAALFAINKNILCVLEKKKSGDHAKYLWVSHWLTIGKARDEIWSPLQFLGRDM